jgi:hypothetical protein
MAPVTSPAIASRRNTPSPLLNFFLYPPPQIALNGIVVSDFTKLVGVEEFGEDEYLFPYTEAQYPLPPSPPPSPYPEAQYPLPPSPTSSRPGSSTSSRPDSPIVFRPGTPDEELSLPATRRLSRLKGGSGKTLGEISNFLSEISTTLVQHSGVNLTTIAIGATGESLYGFSGGWVVISAITRWNSETPIQNSAVLAQGLSSLISGATGVASAFPSTASVFSVSSSATWAISEALNIVQRIHQFGWEIDRGFNKETSICLLQLMGSTIKFVGIVLLLTGGNGLWVLAEFFGTLITFTSGIMNLKHKDRALGDISQRGNTMLLEVSHIARRVSQSRNQGGNQGARR